MSPPPPRQPVIHQPSHPPSWRYRTFLTGFRCHSLFFHMVQSFTLNHDIASFTVIAQTFDITSALTIFTSASPRCHIHSFTRLIMIANKTHISQTITTEVMEEYAEHMTTLLDFLRTGNDKPGLPRSQQRTCFNQRKTHVLRGKSSFNFSLTFYFSFRLAGYVCL